MGTKDGKAYEEFVKRVFQQIHELEGIKTVKVEPSKIFDGNTLDPDGVPIPHQIDVHWTFELDGTEYTTIIQAKDWENQVPQLEMIAFDGIVQDIGNNKTKGQFVARSGFQKGAVNWAKAKGIKASELRHIHPSEKANRIETIVCKIEATLPVVSGITLDLNGWFASLSPSQQEAIANKPFGIDANILQVESEDGTPQGVLADHMNWDKNEMRETFNISLRFEQPLYFHFFSKLPRARVDGLTATVMLHRENHEVKIHQPLTHILRSATGDESYFVSVEDSGELVVKRAMDLPPQEKPRPKSTW